jgi:hypothetical protein
MCFLQDKKSTSSGRAAGVSNTRSILEPPFPSYLIWIQGHLLGLLDEVTQQDTSG